MAEVALSSCSDVFPSGWAGSHNPSKPVFIQLWLRFKPTQNKPGQLIPGVVISEHLTTHTKKKKSYCKGKCNFHSATDQFKALRVVTALVEHNTKIYFYQACRFYHWQ